MQVSAPKCRIGTVLVEQFIMRAPLDEHSFIQHEDTVIVDHIFQTVRD